ncbi:MAG: septum formation inhibitor Maf [Epsilonproteobacteria bacterium]|nr:septum formation inhibitor Maf [Campylobacterota bacterium]
MIRLASGSETRAKLLKEANIPFIQSPINLDEDRFLTLYKEPKEFVKAVTKAKLQQAKKLYPLEPPIVVADTVVSVEGEILRKAKTKAQAKELLLKQSGKGVEIITAMIFANSKKEVFDIDVTGYCFAPFDKEELERYLESGEWKGKAGACMVEGFCQKYIQEMVGRESTAMGLWVERLKELVENS